MTLITKKNDNSVWFFIFQSKNVDILQENIIIEIIDI